MSLPFPMEHIFYKKKVAFKIAYIRPRINEAGDRIERVGAILLEMAESTAPKKYDWDNKKTISITAQEVSVLVVNLRHGQDTEFYHDPGKGGPKEGQVVRKLKAKRTDNGGFAFQIYQKSGGEGKALGTVLSETEYFLFRELTTSVIPKMYGW